MVLARRVAEAGAGVTATGAVVAPATAAVDGTGVSVAAGAIVLLAELHAPTSAAMTIDPARSRFIGFMSSSHLGSEDPAAPIAPSGGSVLAEPSLPAACPSAPR